MKKKQEKKDKTENIHRAFCPDCGCDVSDLLKELRGKAHSARMKEYWADLTPEKEKQKKNFLKRAKEERAKNNACHETNVEKGRRLFLSVDRETRLEYIRKATKARMEKMPEILEKLRQRPEHHEMLRNMRASRMASSARRRYDAIMRRQDIDHSRPCIWIRIHRYNKDVRMNVSSPEEVKELLDEIKPLRNKPIYYREIPGVAPDGVRFQSIYCAFKQAPLVICDVIGMDIGGVFTRRSDELTP